MLNGTTLVGNLTDEPVVKHLASGRGVATFRIAVNRRYQANGTQREDTAYVNVVAFGDLADHCGTALHKGTRVVVTGRIETHGYDTPTGEKRTAFEVVAEDVGLSLRFEAATV